MSLDVVMKHLLVSSCQCTRAKQLCGNELGVWRPHYAENVVMMPCIRPVQNEWRKFADKVVRSLPDLNMRFVCDSNERSIR